MWTLVTPIFRVALAALWLHHGELLRSGQLLFGFNLHKLDAKRWLYQLNRGIQELRGKDFLTSLLFYPLNLVEQADMVILLALILVIVNGIIVFH